MREIKFRVWNGYEMNYNPPISLISTASINDFFESKEVMQSTGLLDKNGKAIYEGDIVSTGLEEYHGNYVIVWNPKELAYGMQSDGGISQMSFWIDNPHKQLEVVGNIYENPELLK